MISQPSLRHIYRVWRRNWEVFQRLWLADVGPMFLEPLVVLGAMGLGLGAYVAIDDTESYLTFIAPGVIGAYALFAAVFECTYGSFMRMEVRRIYHAMIATSITIEDVIVGEILWGATRSLFSATVILIVVTSFGFVSSPLALLVLPVAFLAGLTFSALAMVFTAFAPSMTSFNYFITLFVTPMFLLSGVFFPLDRYPEGLRLLVWALPLTPYVHTIRELVMGSLSLSILWSLLYAILLLTATSWVAVTQMRRRLIR